MDDLKCVGRAVKQKSNHIFINIYIVLCCCCLTDKLCRVESNGSQREVSPMDGQDKGAVTNYGWHWIRQ